MNISEACTRILDQLAILVQEINDRDFIKPSEALSKSTVGQHLRHTLEFFICFEQGFERGVVNYDKRAHDRLTETDKFMALNTIRRIRNFVSTLQGNNKPLRLEVGYDLEKEEYISIEKSSNMQVYVNGKLYNKTPEKFVRIKSKPGLFHVQVKVLNPYDRTWYVVRKDIKVEKGYEFYYKMVFAKGKKTPHPGSKKISGIQQVLPESHALQQTPGNLKSTRYDPDSYRERGTISVFTTYPAADNRSSV